MELKSWFLHADTYLLKLQIDDMILGGRGQACPDMTKEAVKSYWGAIQLWLVIPWFLAQKPVIKTIKLLLKEKHNAKINLDQK